MSEHARTGDPLGARSDEDPGIIDLGSRHFLRPHHFLERRPEDGPPPTPVLAHGGSPVVGLLLWHDCKAQESSWHMVFPAEDADVIECPIAGCGDRGRIRDGRWVVA